MKKVWKMFSVLLFVGLLFTGCTPKENKSDETQEQNGPVCLVRIGPFCLRREIVCAALNQFLDRFIHSKKFFQNIFQKLSGLHP